VTGWPGRPGAAASPTGWTCPAGLESFGIAALEARCVGLPIIAKACAGVADFVTAGVEGVLAGGDADMAHAIAGLVAAPDRRAAIRRHNAAVAPALDWDAALLRTDALYDRAARLAGLGDRVAGPARVRSQRREPAFAGGDEGTR
jgi:glycosyltransferase involved in cell wall biosynthesis